MDLTPVLYQIAKLLMDGAVFVGVVYLVLREFDGGR